MHRIKLRKRNRIVRNSGCPKFRRELRYPDLRSEGRPHETPIPVPIFRGITDWERYYEPV